MVESPVLTMALTKGRILAETLPVLDRAGMAPVEDPRDSRKLVFDSQMPGLRLLVLRGSDVPVYVRRGVASLGVAGKDILLEQGADDLYEPLDLGIARCRLMTAGKPGQAPDGHRLKVATKFVNVARRHYASRGIQAEIIRLNGAMELAPVLGLADEIVDIVDTGGTLRAHGLETREVIDEVSSRLIANKAAMKLQHRRMRDIIERLRAAVAYLETAR